MYKTIETEGWKVSNPFKVATSVSMLDINDDEEKIMALVEEQNAILEKRGYKDNYKCELLRNNKHYRYDCIDDAIQGLALKDGCDLVEFENGNLGFVGYYHGFDENWFEIVSTEYLSDHCDKIDDNTIVVAEDDLLWVLKFEDSSVIEKVIEIVGYAIRDWYDTELYPEYECACIGDIIAERLKENNIKYTQLY